MSNVTVCKGVLVFDTEKGVWVCPECGAVLPEAPWDARVALSVDSVDSDQINL